MAGVGALHHGDPLVLTQLPVQLTVAHVDGIDVAGPMAQQHVGKAPGGGSDIHGHHAGDVCSKNLDGPLDLMPAPAGQGVHLAADIEVVLFLHLFGGLEHLFFGNIDLSGHDQRLGALPAGGQAALHQRHIHTRFHDFFLHVRICWAMDPASNPWARSWLARSPWVIHVPVSPSVRAGPGISFC